MELYDENLLLLRNAIIEQAVNDYKNCVIRGETWTLNFREIEMFFRSEFCGAILGNSGITGADILERLDKWRKQAEKSKYIKRSRNKCRNKV